MALAQFLLPGETVLYEAPGAVYFRHRPFALYVTGERLLLHSAAGRLWGRERAVAEPLASVSFAEYAEGGPLSRGGRLDVYSAGPTLRLTGSPEVIRDVWQALQRHTLRTPASAPDEEATLVAPPPPLFEDEPASPARVQPLAPPPTRRRVFTRAAAIALVCAAALAALAAAVLLGRRAAPTVARTAPPPAPVVTPTPAPTPVALQVMDELFRLEEGAHHAVPFTVPAGRDAARVSGGFRVTDGGQVDFHLMSREQYERFARGGEPEIRSVLYREGQWNARVGERLPAGDYYLVFDNYDPGGEPRTVAAEFFLLLDEAEPAR